MSDRPQQDVESIFLAALEESAPTGRAEYLDEAVEAVWTAHKQ